MSGGDLHHLTRLEVVFYEVTAGVYEHGALALQRLEDETFATEQGRAEPLLERDVEVDRLLGRQEGGLLQDPLLPTTQVEGLHLARDLSGEPYQARTPIRVEVRHEERFTGKGALQALEQSAGDLGLHTDVAAHVHHAPRVGVHDLAWIELDVHEL